MNLKYKFPLIAGCIAGAIAGAFVYIFKLSSLGFGATAIPGITIIDPANNGYIKLHYSSFNRTCLRNSYLLHIWKSKN